MTRLKLGTVVFAALICSGLNAQTLEIQAKIPFDFLVKDKLMPAGEYRFHNGSGYLLVQQQASKHRQGTFVISNVANRYGSHNHAEVKFNRYGSVYFLEEIWEGNEGSTLLKSKREVDLAASVQSSQPSTVLATVGKR
jgi:hypothetical protein